MGKEMDVEGIAVVVNGIVNGAESKELIGMVMDVEGVAGVVNSVMDGGVVVAVTKGATVVAVVICGADGRITVAWYEYPP